MLTNWVILMPCASESAMAMFRSRPTLRFRTRLKADVSVTACPNGYVALLDDDLNVNDRNCYVGGRVLTR